MPPFGEAFAIAFGEGLGQRLEHAKSNASGIALRSLCHRGAIRPPSLCHAFAMAFAIRLPSPSDRTGTFNKEA